MRGCCKRHMGRNDAETVTFPHPKCNHEGVPKEYLERFVIRPRGREVLHPPRHLSHVVWVTQVVDVAVEDPVPHGVGSQRLQPRGASHGVHPVDGQLGKHAHPAAQQGDICPPPAGLHHGGAPLAVPALAGTAAGEGSLAAWGGGRERACVAGVALG